MSNVLRIAVVDPNDATRENLKTVLVGMDMVWLEAECSRYEFFSDVVEQTKPDIALVAMDTDPDRASQLVSEVVAQSPDCILLVTSSSSDGRLILQAMRAGAKEFLTEPLKVEAWGPRVLAPMPQPTTSREQSSRAVPSARPQPQPRYQMSAQYSRENSSRENPQYRSSNQQPSSSTSTPGLIGPIGYDVGK